MKKRFPFGLLVVLVLCIAGSSLFAQSYVVENDLTAEATRSAMSTQLIDPNVSYSGIGLSAPWMYAGDTFRIFLTVENLREEEITHQVRLYRLADPGTGKRIIQTEMKVTLAAGAKNNIELPLVPEELVASGEPLEEAFVFFLGQYEIGLECEW